MTSRKIVTPQSSADKRVAHLSKVLSQIQEEKQIRLARTDFNTFAECVLLDEHGYPVKQDAIHESWTQFIEDSWARGEYPAILAPWGSGKSLTISSTYECSDSSIRQIDSPILNGTILGIDDDCKVQNVKILNARCTGFGTTIKITTRSGRELECTPNHKILEFFKYREAKDLKVGDRISLIRRYTPTNLTPIDKGIGYFLGVLIGDGCLTGSRIRLANSNRGVITKFASICESFGWNVSIHGKPNKMESTLKKAVSQDILLKYNLSKVNSYTKTVPEQIITAQDSEVIGFLSGYFDTDGCCNCTSNTIEYSSVNKSVLKSVQNLLLRFGIISYLKKRSSRYKGEPYKSYRLVLSGIDLINFNNLLAMQNVEKKAQLQKFVDKLSSVKRNSNNDIVPMEWRKHIQTSEFRLQKDHGIRINKNKSGHNRELIKQIADLENNEELYRILDTDIFWDEIVSIEESSVYQPVYDIETEPTHNFVSDGIVIHNSVQQAIGRVLFELGKDINLRCKIVCNNSTQAAKRVITLKNYIESSKPLRKIFPHLRPSSSHWTTTSFDVENKLWSEIDHTLEAYGIESRAVGGRADLLIFDDAVDDKSEYSKVYRKMTLDNFENVFMSRLEPNARVVLIGTMWHRSDLHCSLIGREGWRFLIQGVSDDFKFIESIII